MMLKKGGPLVPLLPIFVVWLSATALSGCLKRDDGGGDGDESGPVQPGPGEEPDTAPTQNQHDRPRTPSERTPEGLVPSVSHLSFWTGVTPLKSAAFTATHAGDSWRVRPVVASDEDNRYGGRLNVQVNAQGRQMVLLSRYQTTELNRPRIELMAASEGDEGYSFDTLTGANRPDVVSMMAESTASSRGSVATIIVNYADGASQLKFVRLADSSVQALNLDVSTNALGIADVAIGAERSGRHAVVYVKNGKLAHGQAADNGWASEPTVEKVPGCHSVQLISADTADDGSVFVAAACNVTIDDTRQKCVLNVGYGQAGKPLDYQALATIDPDEACRPFASDRPNIGVDRKGKAHVVYRQRLAAGQWQIVYLAGNPARGFGAPQPISEPGTKVSFPRCDVDANDAIAISWLDDGSIWVATGPSGDALVKEPLRAQNGELVLATSLGSLTSGHPR